MNFKSRAQALWRLAVLAAVVVPLLVMMGAPASASPPSNDDIANATEITSLPFREVVDLSQATWDFSTDSSRCAGYGRSVWYSFTPASDELVAFDPSASNYYMDIDVFTGSPGALSFVGCRQLGGYVLNAIGGTTYWIMASTNCCAAPPNPILDLYVYPAVAPPQATVSIESGTADRGGNVTINGTLDCAGIAPTGGRIAGTVRQSVGRLSSVSATFTATASCAGTQQWTALAQPAVGKFTGGPATVNASATVCNAVGCSTPSVTAVITLRGS
jgi:hypothetical protein